MSGQPASRAAAPRLRLAVLWYALGAALLLAVAILSLMPLPDAGVGDKISHVVTYIALAGYFSVLARQARALYRVAVGIMVYGALIEIAQGLTGYRNAEWGDLLANGVGTAVGVTLHFTPLGRILGWIDLRLAQRLER